MWCICRWWRRNKRKAAANYYIKKQQPDTMQPWPTWSSWKRSLNAPSASPSKLSEYRNVNLQSIWATQFVFDIHDDFMTCHRIDFPNWSNELYFNQNSRRVSVYMSMHCLSRNLKNVLVFCLKSVFWAQYQECHFSCASLYPPLCIYIVSYQSSCSLTVHAEWQMGNPPPNTQKTWQDKLL